MCTTPCPKRQAVFGALAGDEAAHTAFTRAIVGAPTAVAALPTVVAKKAGAVDGAPTLVANTSKAPVAREAKASKECSPAMAVANTSEGPMAIEAKASKKCSLAMADVAAPMDVVAVPAPDTKTTGLFHPTSVMVEILGTEMGDWGCSCEEHASNTAVR